MRRSERSFREKSSPRVGVLLMKAPLLEQFGIAEKKLRRLTGGASERMGRRGFLKPGRIFEALTTPTVFPALGHDVSKVYWTHSKDLLAQKVSSPPQL